MMINWHAAKVMAARYGADQPAFPASHPAAQAWIDRIAWLPAADDQDTLAEAIDEANRCSGTGKGRSDG
jgi:hypothetical protein